MVSTWVLYFTHHTTFLFWYHGRTVIITHVCLEQSSSYTMMQYFTENSLLYICSIIYHIKSSPCLTLLSVSDLIYTSHGFYFVSWITVNNSVVCMILLTNHCIVTLYEHDIFAVTNLISVMDCSGIFLFYLGLPDYPASKLNEPKG